MHTVLARNTFEVKMVKAQRVRRQWRYSKSIRRCGTKHVSKSKCQRHRILVQLLEVQGPFFRQAQWILHLAKGETESFVAPLKKGTWLEYHCYDVVVFDQWVPTADLSFVGQHMVASDMGTMKRPEIAAMLGTVAPTPASSVRALT